MLNKYARNVILALAGLTASALLFFNCSNSTPSAPTQSSSSSSVNSPTSPAATASAPLSAVVIPTTITLGTTTLSAQITASGGTSPYRYFVVGSGGPTVTSDGVVTNFTQAGSVDLEVTDAIGNTFYTALQVVASTTTSPPVNPSGTCVLDNQTYAAGTQVQAWQTASVGCGQSCASQLRTCTSNGTFDGDSSYAVVGGCSATACQWQNTGAPCANPLGSYNGPGGIFRAQAAPSGACSAPHASECIDTGTATQAHGNFSGTEILTTYVCE